MQKIAESVGYGGATALGLVLLGIEAFFIRQEALIPGAWSGILILFWLIALAILLVVCVVMGSISKKRPIGILIDERNRISLARMQWLAWFLVLFSAYYTGAVWDTAFGGDLPAIEPNLFGLIGITSASAVISNVLVDAKKQEKVPDNSQVGPGPLQGRADVNNDAKDASWADLYLG